MCNGRAVWVKKLSIGRDWVVGSLICLFRLGNMRFRIYWGGVYVMMGAAVISVLDFVLL
jgi:hypothetical protein